MFIGIEIDWGTATTVATGTAGREITAVAGTETGGMIVGIVPTGGVIGTVIETEIAASPGSPRTKTRNGKGRKILTIVWERWLVWEATTNPGGIGPAGTGGTRTAIRRTSLRRHHLHLAPTGPCLRTRKISWGVRLNEHHLGVISLTSEGQWTISNHPL